MGNMHASFSGKIRLYALDTKVYLHYLTIILVNIYLCKANNKCNKSTNKVKKNIPWDVDLGVFSHIAIIAVSTFICLYTNLLLTYIL